MTYIFRPGVYNVTAAGRATIAQPGGAAAPAPWWMLAGFAPLAAYQPKDAASLAASYINLANPGTYDAAPGVAPAWDAASGWKWVSTLEWLGTGIVPANGFSTLIRFSNRTVSGCLMHAGLTAGRFFGPWADFGGQRAYLSGGFIATGVTANSGIIGITGQQGYYWTLGMVGGADGGAIGAWTGPGVQQIVIGGSPADGPNYYIQAVGIWEDDITASIATIAAAMAA